ncbi:hypothetical protein [Nonomuraea sp. NEAU-A123]|uniref:hypothetical protein n=1 Tax=Nonomuraea sp. NEAU-A123 TaxID=2839649 RepID=UPI001BE426E3|nr:hypothetical protein [Nonomuraea sp. NEAU-A123]MBT2226258.1 hypothetical protein [Nonomuraea sp. NEAU-A123]
MAVNLDKMALGLANALLACFCSALEGSTGGSPCHCCLAVGPPPADFCCECPSGASGQAWVRVVAIFPSSKFPARTNELVRCGQSAAYAVELELGAYRCVATLDDAGDPPSCEATTRDVEVQVDDAAAMRAAVCCFRAQDGGRILVPGEWSPIPPNGGCAGGVMRVTVQAYTCCP